MRLAGVRGQDGYCNLPAANLGLMNPIKVRTNVARDRIAWQILICTPLPGLEYIKSSESDQKKREILEIKEYVARQIIWTPNVACGWNSFNATALRISHVHRKADLDETFIDTIELNIYSRMYLFRRQTKL